MCDECEGMECAGRYAPYFCGDVSCLQYFCETCWDNYHYGTYSDERRAFHKPLVRVGDQTKVKSYLYSKNKSSGSTWNSFRTLRTLRYSRTSSSATLGYLIF